MLSETESELAKKTTLVISVALALIGTILVFYIAAPAFFLIFGGFLVAAIFRALALPLEKLGLPFKAAVAISTVVFFAGLLGVLVYGGATLVQEYNALFNQVAAQIESTRDTLQDMGIAFGDAAGGSGSFGFASFIPNPAGLFSSFSTAVFSLLGGLGNTFVILFIAIFVIAQPTIYRHGVVSLFPRSKRRRMDETFRAAGHELVLWVCGTGISMATVFVVTWAGLALIGMPSAFLLALQAGLLAFIPTLGPFIAGIPIVITGLSISIPMAAWALGVYVLIQGVESYVSQPVAQRLTSALPPVLTIGAQVVFGVMFGVLGVIIAVPFVAVVRTIITELYVKDTLGGPYGGYDEP